ncbi:MAG: Gfo/Idh/MocA family oxidoreductase [Planctomycetes bacterium]|nr:Gfo/Idh/MocA family oxidoreductase [Planctomycetota bacterium]
MVEKPLKVAVVGAGHRSVGYAAYALRHPDRMKVVAVADPVEHRRAALAERHGLAGDMLFESYEDMAARPKFADAVINGTMDRLHYSSSMPFLRQGYHMLLEKPIAATADEVRGLIRTAGDNGAVVMICHVLRYAPFYSTIKRLLLDGRIGDVVSLHTSENVSYHHMATGFVRGRWRKEADSNPMLLAKCCHDMDIIAWIVSGVAARRVSSFGSLVHFRPENAPEGSAERCLDGCRIEPDCPYSAKTMYVEQKLWGFYAWEPIEHVPDATDERKLESLKTDNPYGRCVWHCDNDVVDHQSVLIEFENGVTATHDMFTGAARGSRTIHVVGTKGEVEGDMEAGELVLRLPCGEPGRTYTEEHVDIGVRGDGHGGGDGLLVDDFVSTLLGEETSRGVTRIEDSLTGHLIAFAADSSMRGHRTVEIDA